MPRLALILCALACTHAPASPASSDPAARLRALADQYTDGLFAADPILATQSGDSRFDDKLPDAISPAGRARIRALHETTRARLLAISRGQLSGEDALTWDVLDNLTQDGIDGVTWDDHLMPVEQLGSLPVALPVIGSGTGTHPFKTVADYQHFLARMDAFDGWVSQAIENLAEGMKAGLTRPRPVMERVLPQLASVAGKQPEETAFWGAIKLMPASFSEADRARLTAQYRSMLEGRLIPAYQRLHGFLKDTYLPACRATTALEALPDGKERYAYRVRLYTTSPLDAHQIHELGLREVARILGEIEQLRVKEGFAGSAPSFLAAMRRDPRGAVRTGDELLAAYGQLKERVKAQLPELFGHLPRADFEVRLIEPFREDSAPSQYTPASPDGSRPGIFYANAAGLKDSPARPSQPLFLHEAIPGHHFQIALASENAALPRLRRLPFYNAYLEGWALYAESLGPRLGFYEDAPRRAGALASELFRAMRLVVDTGMHHEGWSREKAIQYLAATGGYQPDDVTGEIDRYLADPGQALGYKVGELAIRELRAAEEKRLGDKFDLRAFHDRVLESGALPLALLQRKFAAR